MFSSQLDFQKIKLRIVKLFNNFWQFCVTWNQSTFTLVQVFQHRLQVVKTEIMLQYFDKNKKKIQSTDSSTVPTFSQLDFPSIKIL